MIARHGETEWSRDRQHTSTTDVPLTARGEEQARELAASLSGRAFGLVLVSPRQRARRTAELAGFTRYESSDDLVEWAYGDYEGRTTRQISADLGREWDIWTAGVQRDARLGESLSAVGERADRVIGRALPVLRGGQNVLLVAHSHLLRVLTARWLGLPAADGALFVLDTGTWSELGFERDRRVVSRWNA